MINFKGSLVQITKVQQLNNNSYSEIPAYLIELDTKSQDDFKVLENISKEWKYNDLYANDVFCRFKENYNKTNLENNERFFVLTKQKSNHEILDFTKVLGVAELYKPSGEPIEIEFLQTNPSYLNSKTAPKIKHIGIAIVEGFKKILKDKEIALFTTDAARSFYAKLGFINIDPYSMIFRR